MTDSLAFYNPAQAGHGIVEGAPLDLLLVVVRALTMLIKQQTHTVVALSLKRSTTELKSLKQAKHMFALTIALCSPVRARTHTRADAEGQRRSAVARRCWQRHCASAARCRRRSCRARRTACVSRRSPLTLATSGRPKPRSDAWRPAASSWRSTRSYGRRASQVQSCALTGALCCQPQGVCVLQP